jgi:hypothetical protein
MNAVKMLLATELLRAVRWLQRPAPRSWTLVVFACCIVTGILLGVALGDTNTVARRSADQQHTISSQQHAITDLVRRLAGDEHQSCVIQARGLPGGHYLAIIISDVHDLFTIPLTAAQRAQESQAPPGYLSIERSLAYYTGLYTDVESTQPKHRSCR